MGVGEGVMKFLGEFFQNVSRLKVCTEFKKGKHSTPLSEAIGALMLFPQ